MSTDPSTTPDRLQQQFGLPDAVRFESAEGGLTRAVLTSPTARGIVYLHGAHVSAYQPADQPEVFYLSQGSAFAPGQPIRGGIPICFPWFADHGTPKHGTARLQSWSVHDARADGDHVTLELTTTVEPYTLHYRVSVGPTLEVALRTRNSGATAATFELALHSYFVVSDVRQVEVVGLEERPYLDKPENFAPRTQQGPIRFTGEVDRVYQHTTDTCTIHDPGLARTITIEKQNAHSTIVWNPGPEKGAALDDMPPDDWQRFVCVESGNVHDNAITLQPGAEHETLARITAQPA
ncbi:MAG: D-hexose-6-phosphate mutarotase [Phycisphaeraceae bacterium]